jgi:hypothetical protein
MNWTESQESLRRELSPEVGCFVNQVLRQLEQENVFDAPSVIGMIVQRMQVADSDVIRAAVTQTEHILKVTFMPVLRVKRHVGA